MSSEDLSEVFAKFGEVTNSTIITDRETGRSKGFGFIEMETSIAGNEAIEALNGNDCEGRTLRVNEAKPREERPSKSY